MYFSGHFMTIFRSNYIHLKFFFLISILLFVKYMLMYLTFSNLNSIHWLIIKKNVLFRTFSGHFMTIFRSNYFHLKWSFFIFFEIFVTYMLMYLRFSNQVNFQDISVTLARLSLVRTWPKIISIRITIRSTVSTLWLRNLAMLSIVRKLTNEIVFHWRFCQQKTGEFTQDNFLSLRFAVGVWCMNGLLCCEIRLGESDLPTQKHP